MRPYKVLAKFEDFWVPLLEVLAEMPGHAGKVRDVIKAFEARNRQIMHPEQLQFMEAQGEPRWAYNLRWSRQSLLGMGLMDAPAWGVWRITQTGLGWLRDHSEETHVGAEMLPARDAVSRQQTKAASRSAERLSFKYGDRQFDLSADQVLEAARRSLVDGLPHQVGRYRHWVVMVDGKPVGLKSLFSVATGLRNDEFTTYFARDMLRHLGLEVTRLTEKSERAKPTPTSRPNDRDEERRLVDAVRAEVTAIRDLLRGRGERPSDDRLCDMVQFCYTIALYREGCALFALVDKACANGWQYERTRKVARICELRENHDR